ncbi:hypothetical protein [Pseudooceanicola sp. MF1-13]|uniref:hypothetical protein n=1 Tax=Pseudooceanicola sp. MF1-13 TaxID=3379095 RepID=UPI003892853B
MFLWFWTLLILSASGVTDDTIEASAPATPASPSAPSSPDTPAQPDSPDTPADPATPAYTADPQTPTGKFTTATEVKPILSMTKPQWIGVREYDGQDLVYVTQIMAWRCGLAGLRLAVNDADLADWPLPPCHADSPAPNALLPEDGLPYRAFPLGSVDTVTVEVIYDDLTTDAGVFLRQNVLIP